MDRATARFGRQLPTLIAGLLLFAACGLTLLRVTEYPVLDLLAYVSVAQKYATGDFAEAINGCWSPLGSWLLVPFLWAGVEPLLGYRILHLLIGAVAVCGFWLLSRRFEMAPAIRTAAVLMAALLLVSFGYVPDLLLCTVLLFYLHLAHDPDYGLRPGRGLACGVLGGVAYLAKSYGLPLFLLHFTLANLLHRARGRRVLASYALGLFGFALVSGPWIAALSHTYGGFTTNTVGPYTHAVLGPSYRDHPTFTEGFFAPPNPTAISIWEDPTRIPLRSWNPLGSLPELRHQLWISAQAMSNLLVLYNETTGLWVAVLLFYLLRCIPLRRGLRSGELLPLLTVLVYPSGYLLTQVDVWIGRYIWINALLLLLMAGHATDVLRRAGGFGRGRSAVLVGGVLASFLPGVAWNVHRLTDVCKSEYTLGVELGREFDLSGKRLASNARVHNSTYLAYRMGARYFGKQVRGLTDFDLQQELKAYGIDYFVYWRELESGFRGVPEFLRECRDITGGRYPLVHIYALGERH